MSQIFLSYRRSDAADATARIHDHLDIYFGKQITFRDVDGMHPGMHFPDELEKRLSGCQLAVVVIGPNWLKASAADGSRRIDSEADFVRIEVSTLLKLRKPIIPVLVSGAAIPTANELPSDIAPLAFIHAISLPATTGFSSAMLEVVRQIHRITKLHYEEYGKTLHQCQEIGLVTVLNSFLDDITVREEIRSADELVVVMNDGRNFVNDNQELLDKRLRDRSKTSTFVFYHPASGFFPTLLKKNRKGDRQLAEMKASFDLLTRFGATEIRGHHLFSPYSLTMSENYAFVSPYRFLEGGALPLFKFSAKAPSGYYHVLREDALKLIKSADILSSKDFNTGIAESG
ncbi:MAG: toll/interleukin-1 receptor domain-containing protein [Acidobacteriaceae bacterium]|nr:toll/interleukin-1 receptor domain-containing protein [Acidobacteriaceae bacterium]